MENQNIEKFLKSCDELINCKFLVAEYKLQKMLQELANNQEICSLIEECLEQFNKDREFAKSFVQDSNGDYKFILPDEEYKVIALVFCLLVDIDAKKIDFTDFVKKFFDDGENAYKNFVNSTVIPFKNLIQEAFNYQPQVEYDMHESERLAEEEPEEEAQQLPQEGDEDKFVYAQKIAVQILSQLEYGRDDYANQMAMQICRAIVKTANQKDEEIMTSLAFALKNCKAKQVKFLIKELCDLFI